MAFLAFTLIAFPSRRRPHIIYICVRKSRMTSWLGWMRQDTEKPPFWLQYRSSKLYIVSAVAIAIFTVRPTHPIMESRTNARDKDLFLYGLIVPVTPFAITDRSGVSPDRGRCFRSYVLRAKCLSSLKDLSRLLHFHDCRLIDSVSHQSNTGSLSCLLYMALLFL